jgi:DNA-binding transcriptional ArsR family regulator
LRTRRRQPPIPDLTNARLAKAMSHPTRVHILSVVHTRPASAKEIAAELGEPTPNVKHHIQALRGLGCIEIAEERPKHGNRVVEHFYRATKLRYFDDEAWGQLDLKGKWQVVMPIMRLASRDISEALVAGTFMDPDDNHVTRTPMIVDREGWEESKAVLADALDGLLEVKDRVEARREAGSEEETMAIKVEIIHFRSPDRDRDP